VDDVDDDEIEKQVVTNRSWVLAAEMLVLVFVVVVVDYNAD
jgi:hypothetical protein